MKTTQKPKKIILKTTQDFFNETLHKILQSPFSYDWVLSSHVVPLKRSWLEPLKGFINWTNFSLRKDVIPHNILDKYSRNIDWVVLASHQPLSKSFLKKFEYNLPVAELVKNPSLDLKVLKRSSELLARIILEKSFSRRWTTYDQLNSETMYMDIIVRCLKDPSEALKYINHSDGYIQKISEIILENFAD